MAPRAYRARSRGRRAIRENAGQEGPQGPAGPAGAPGTNTTSSDPFTGSQGPQGAKGDTGPAGAKGDTGEAGPAGKDGADGKDGAQGPQGSPGLTPPLTTSIAVGQSANDTATHKVANATCPAGARATGGGFAIVPSDPGIIPTASSPVGNTGWSATVDQLSLPPGTNWQVLVFAVCLS